MCVCACARDQARPAHGQGARAQHRHERGLAPLISSVRGGADDEVIPDGKVVRSRAPKVFSSTQGLPEVNTIIFLPLVSNHKIEKYIPS